RVVVGVDGGAGGADRGTEGVGHRLDDIGEALGGRDAAAAGDDDLGLGQLGAVAALGRGEGHDLHGGLVRGRVLHGGHGRRGGGLYRVDRAGAQRVGRGGAVAGALDDELAAEDRVDRCAVLLDLRDVGQDAGAGQGGDAAGDLLAGGGGGDEHRDLALGGQAHEDVDLGGDQVLAGLIGLGGED